MSKKTEAAVAPVVAADPELATVERAWKLGNMSMVRTLAASATSPAAKEAAQRLLPQFVVEKETALVGLAGLAVILVAAALSLVAG
ncbi:MAG TPA: hypothetical protein VGF99_16470 [Myxococcota bacterium]